jgi:hypothetical protein
MRRRSVGCLWVGPHNSLEAHLRKCVFESLKDYIAQTNDRLVTLDKQMRAQKAEIRALKKYIVASFTVPKYVPSRPFAADHEGDEEDAADGTDDATLSDPLLLPMSPPPDTPVDTHATLASTAAPAAVGAATTAASATECVECVCVGGVTCDVASAQIVYN